MKVNGKLWKEKPTKRQKICIARKYQANGLPASVKTFTWLPTLGIYQWRQCQNNCSEPEDWNGNETNSNIHKVTRQSRINSAAVSPGWSNKKSQVLRASETVKWKSITCCVITFTIEWKFKKYYWDSHENINITMIIFYKS